MSALFRHDALLLKEVEWLAGVDEAGRGALAGPVVAGACVIHRDFVGSRKARKACAAMNDSKQLSAGARDGLFETINFLKAEGLLDFATGTGSVAEIEKHNILGATRLAMRRALESIAAGARGWVLPEVASGGPLFAATSGAPRIIVDGRPLKPFPYEHTGIVGGDGRSLCIAMASIAAKVTRDRLVTDLEKRFPHYGFAQHKGYGTAAHRKALAENGPCPEHRSLFLRKVLG